MSESTGISVPQETKKVLLLWPDKQDCLKRLRAMYRYYDGQEFLAPFVVENLLPNCKDRLTAEQFIERAGFEAVQAVFAKANAERACTIFLGYPARCIIVNAKAARSTKLYLAYRQEIAAR